MSDTLTPLICQLVQWVAREPRTYEATMQAWRTSCPRLTVWEDALDRGYLERVRNANGDAAVIVTQAGREFLAAHAR